MEKTQPEQSFLLRVLVLSAILHVMIGYLLFQSHSAPKNIEQSRVQTKPIQARLVFTPIEQPKPEPFQEVETETKIAAEKEQLPVQLTPVESTNTPTFVLPQISSPSLPTKGIATRDLAKHHLKDFTRNANNALAEREAARYRQQQNSPEIIAPESDPFLTEDEKFIKHQAVRVDCSSGLNKSLAVVSKFTGGNLDCSKSQSLTPFINKHLKKGVETDHK